MYKNTKETLILLKGQTIKVKPAQFTGKIKWKSSKRAIASVSATGKIKARKKGTAIITAKSNSKTVQYKVTVQDPSLSKTRLSMKKGSSTTLKLKGTTQKIVWTSSNPKIAEVNRKGKIKAKKPGTAIITATVKNKAFPCRVTVKKAQGNSQNSSSSDNSDSSNNSGSNSSSADDGYVWISRTGSKYHKYSSCSGMRSPSRIPLSQAYGYEPCQKCY